MVGLYTNLYAVTRLEDKIVFGPDDLFIIVIMRREAILTIFLLSNILYEGIETHVEQQRAEAVPLENPYVYRNIRSSLFISYNGCVEVFIKSGY